MSTFHNYIVLQYVVGCYRVLQCVLQCVAVMYAGCVAAMKLFLAKCVCCSVLQCVAVICALYVAVCVAVMK